MIEKCLCLKCAFNYNLCCWFFFIFYFAMQCCFFSITICSWKWGKKSSQIYMTQYFFVCCRRRKEWWSKCKQECTNGWRKRSVIYETLWLFLKFREQDRGWQKGGVRPRDRESARARLYVCVFQERWNSSILKFNYKMQFTTTTLPRRIHFEISDYFVASI